MALSAAAALLSHRLSIPVSPVRRSVADSDWDWDSDPASRSLSATAAAAAVGLPVKAGKGEGGGGWRVYHEVDEADLELGPRLPAPKRGDPRGASDRDASDRDASEGAAATAAQLDAGGGCVFWMHAATRGCTHLSDSSDSAAGAACAATSARSLLRRQSDRGLRLTPGPVPAGDPDIACLRYATHPPLAGPWCRLPTVSAHANCASSDGPSSTPLLESLTSWPGLGAGRRHSQCRATVGQGLTAPTSDPHSLRASSVYRGRLRSTV